jgi:transposase InsO family protein
MGKLIMSNKEREQLVVFKKLQNSEISRTVAARLLDISVRWLRDKYNRFLAEGDAGIVHKARGRESESRWDKSEDCKFTLELLRSDWCGFGPTYTSQKLKKLYGKKVSRETIRQIMKANGIEYRRRKRGKYRRRRVPRAILGLMVQLDGSPHDWFEGRGPRCTLLVFIDDATSQILWLEFVESESLHAVMEATKNYFAKYGRPGEFYVDYGSVFSVNTNNQNRHKITQFERAMKELGVTIIHAKSPQAKGRVERCNRTMQDRLVFELRLANICSIDQANRFLRTNDFIAEHNASYAREAAQPGDAHRSMENYDLKNILCIKVERVVANDYTLSYKRRILQLLDTKSVLVRPKDHIKLHEHLDGSISLFARKKSLAFREIGTKEPTKLSPVAYVNLERDASIEAPFPRETSESALAINSNLLNQLEQAHFKALALQALSR